MTISGGDIIATAKEIRESMMKKLKEADNADLKEKPRKSKSIEEVLYRTSPKALKSYRKLKRMVDIYDRL